MFLILKTKLLVQTQNRFIISMLKVWKDFKLSVIFITISEFVSKLVTIIVHTCRFLITFLVLKQKS